MEPETVENEQKVMTELISEIQKIIEGNRIFLEKLNSDSDVTDIE